MRQQSNKKSKDPSVKKVDIEFDWILNLDIMGERFKFNYSKTGKRFKTIGGGVLTILVTILSLAALILIFSQYFDTRSPVVTTVRELSSSAQSFNIYEKDLFPGITVGFMNVYEPLKMNNFITIRGQLVQKTFDPQSNTTHIDLSRNYNYIPCSSITEDEALLAW